MWREHRDRSSNLSKIRVYGMNSNSGRQSYNSKSFLGVDRPVLEAFMGIPTISFMYKGNEVYVYEEAGINTFEINHGVVVKSNAVPDRRKAFRVSPSIQVKAKLRTQEDEITGFLKDISTAGAAVMISATNKTRLDSGATVFLKCSLPVPEDKPSHDFVIKSTIFRVAVHSDSARIILIFPPWDHSPHHQLLSKYILFRQVEMFLKSMCI